jgi:hypothetical protein
VYPRHNKRLLFTQKYRTRMVFLGNPALPFAFYASNEQAHLAGE